MFWVAVAVVAAIGLSFGLRLLRARQGAHPTGSAGAPALREAVLTRAMLAGQADQNGTAIRAVVMDWAVGDGAATLVAFDDGTTSLYLSSGGGVIGAGTHPIVQQAATEFRSEAERARSRFATVNEPDPYALPPRETAVFYLVTPAATWRSGPTDTARLAEGHDPLSRLWDAAQAVIAAIRQSSA